MLTKTEIKDLSKRHDFYLKKRLGQNFLIDRNLRDKIIRLSDLNKNEPILEIGSGLGALTEKLAEKCGYVYALEKDKKLYNLSKELLGGYKNLEIICGDFLKFDISRLLFKKIKVVGALPYYITTPVIQRLLDFRKRIETIFIIVQKEVGRRLVARAGEDDYSALSLFVQFYSDVKMLMNIKKDAFFPKPDVDSALVRLKILPQPKVMVKDEDMLFKVIRSSFNQRRKTLLSALSHKSQLGIDKTRMAQLLSDLGIDSKKRAESLRLDQFAKIANGMVDFLS